MESALKRNIDYLRLSLTDQCNLKCNYCMPKDGIILPDETDILSSDEVFSLARIFVSMGITKIRLTGGEPLLRKEFLKIAQNIKSLPGLSELCLTTNGILLDRMAADIMKIGFDGINISLDTLEKDKYQQITGVDGLARVISGIKALKEMDRSRVKLNVVVLRSTNFNELNTFIHFAREERIEVRFIELMRTTPLWSSCAYVSKQEMIEACAKNYPMKRIARGEDLHSPAEYYLINGARIGFISTHLDNCLRCNRLRLSSRGILRSCLYQSSGLDLKRLLAQKETGVIRKKIWNIMQRKEDISYLSWEDQSLYMSSIGG